MAHQTLYEIAMERDGVRYLVRYAARLSKQGLWSSLVNSDEVREAVVEIAGTAQWCWDCSREGPRRFRAAGYMGEWRVFFTRRTELDAKRGVDGELPFVCDVVEQLRDAAAQEVA